MTQSCHISRIFSEIARFKSYDEVCCQDTAPFQKNSTFVADLQPNLAKCQFIYLTKLEKKTLTSAPSCPEG
jgi:hypothetical protein